MKKLIFALTIYGVAIGCMLAQGGTRKVFTINNKSQAECIAIYNKFNRQLRKTMAEYPQYADCSNTNILWTSIDGKGETLRWDDLHWWTNAAGDVSVAWFAALPEPETNGIPFKSIVFDAIGKEQIDAYMASNSCSIQVVDINYKVITNSTVISSYGDNQ